MTKRAKTTASSNAGSFAPDAKAEASEVELGEDRVEVNPFTMSREELLGDPDVRFAPRGWLDDKDDHELAFMINEMRKARLHAAEELAEAEQGRQQEISRRRAYRRPEWLRMSKQGSERSYSTADGYSGRDVLVYSDGRARLAYVVSGPGADDSRSTVEVGRVEEMVQWIEKQRIARESTWTEAFPSSSPAATVAKFRGRPTRTWIGTGPEEEAFFIGIDGGYVSVYPDFEEADRWFIYGEFADGTQLDHFTDDKDESMFRGREMLDAGSDEWRRQTGQ